MTPEGVIIVAFTWSNPYCINLIHPALTSCDSESAGNTSNRQRGEMVWHAREKHHGASERSPDHPGPTTITEPQVPTSAHLRQLSASILRAHTVAARTTHIEQGSGAPHQPTWVADLVPPASANEETGRGEIRATRRPHPPCDAPGF
jgi:hypothetical protein